MNVTLSAPRRCLRAAIAILVLAAAGPLRLTALDAPRAAALAEQVDSLLRVLDQVIDSRNVFLSEKEAGIAQLKKRRAGKLSDREAYACNSQIISQYESFICDSAKSYLHQNLDIARRLGDAELIHESTIRLANVNAMGGQFVLARDLFDAIAYSDLPSHHKALYCWAKIKYLRNMLLSTNEPSYKSRLASSSEALRDSLIAMFTPGSDLYMKEVAARHADNGNCKAAIQIYLDLFRSVKTGTHDYAMMAKGLADLYAKLGDNAEEKRLLALSAITDTRLVVKENESLLALAEMLYAEGDIERAYRYMHAALDDANFYNSQVKNSQIARVYPIVENAYLAQLNQQQRRVNVYSIILGVLALLLMLVAMMFYKQTRTVMRSRAELSVANSYLASVSRKLAEANLIRESYVSFFMHQYSLSIDRLEEFRKNVNRKLKANQYSELYTMSARPLEKELEALYSNFDRAFLSLFPDFIEQFNALLLPEARQNVAKGTLNVTLRIFALMRLGVTDMTQIAKFLHCSVQTVYNYRSRIRKSLLIQPEEFEEKIKRIGVLAVTPPPAAPAQE